MSNGQWQLTALTEALGDLVLPIGKVLTVGRGKDNDVVLGSKEVSRQHAKLQLDNDTLTVTDLGSSNGTSVNAAKLTPNESKILVDGDTVSFATFDFKVNQQPEILASSNETLPPVEHTTEDVEAMTGDEERVEQVTDEVAEADLLAATTAVIDHTDAKDHKVEASLSNPVSTPQKANVEQSVADIDIAPVTDDLTKDKAGDTDSKEVKKDVVLSDDNALLTEEINEQPITVSEDNVVNDVQDTVAPEKIVPEKVVPELEVEPVTEATMTKQIEPDYPDHPLKTEEVDINNKAELEAELEAELAEPIPYGNPNQDSGHIVSEKAQDGTEQLLAEGDFVEPRDKPIKKSAMVNDAANSPEHFAELAEEADPDVLKAKQAATAQLSATNNTHGVPGTDSDLSDQSTTDYPQPHHADVPASNDANASTGGNSWMIWLLVALIVIALAIWMMTRMNGA